MCNIKLECVKDKNNEEIFEAIKISWSKIEKELDKEHWDDEVVDNYEMIISYGDYLKEYRGLDDDTFRQIDREASSCVKRCQKYL